MEFKLVAYQHALAQNIEKLQEMKKRLESCADSEKQSLESSMHEIYERILEIGRNQRPLIFEHRVRMQEHQKLFDEKLSMFRALGLQTKTESEEQNAQHSRLRRQRTTATGATSHSKRQHQSRSRRNRKAPAKYDPSPQQENAVEGQKRGPRQRRSKQVQPVGLESIQKFEGDPIDAEGLAEEDPEFSSAIEISNDNVAVNSPTPPSRNTRSQKGVLKPSRIKHLLEKPKRQRRTRNEIEVAANFEESNEVQSSEIQQIQVKPGEIQQIQIETGEIQQIQIEPGEIQQIQIEPGEIQGTQPSPKRPRRYNRKPPADGEILESGEILSYGEDGSIETGPAPPAVAPTLRTMPPNTTSFPSATIRIIRVPVDQFSGSSSGHSSPRLDVKSITTS